MITKLKELLAITFVHVHLTGGPPQQAPPVSVPSSMPGPPGGAMGAPMRGPPPPRPPMGGMPPGGVCSVNDRFIVMCELMKCESCLWSTYRKVGAKY